MVNSLNIARKDNKNFAYCNPVAGILQWLGVSRPAFGWNGVESDRKIVCRRGVRYRDRTGPGVSVQGRGVPDPFSGGVGFGAADGGVAVWFRRAAGDARRAAVRSQPRGGAGGQRHRLHGARTIIIHRQFVRGLTTAASLWATAGIGLAAGVRMYWLAGAATLLTLFGLEALSLFFGGLGRRRTMIVYTATERSTVDAMFAALASRKFGVASYEVETLHAADGLAYRVTLVLHAGRTGGVEAYVSLLREHPDAVVERIV